MKAEIIIDDQWYDNHEEMSLAHHLIDLENDALDRFFNGDMSGYRNLWSKKSFTYFDANTVKRVGSLDRMDTFLNNLEGFMHADSYRFESPRVQFSDDHTMGILTYQLFADTNIANLCYNVVEVFQKEDHGWHVVHSTWSFIKPMNIDWAHFRKI